MSAPRVRAFAVLVPLLDHLGERCVLLTQRNATLSRYAGQVAFPGGGWEEGDEDLRATALREAREEVALPPERVSILRELEWFETTLGHRVKPFVAAVTTPVELVPDPREVERVIYLPVALLRSQPFAVRGHYRRDPDGERHAVYTLTHDGAEIWGLTARILMRLVERMESDGTPERACAPKSRT